MQVVYSHSYWLVIILYNQKQPSAVEEKVANFREFLQKNTIPFLMNTLYIICTPNFGLVVAYVRPNPK